MVHLIRFVRVAVPALVALVLVFGCVRLCTGCALVERAAPKERVAEIVRTAYAEGGREAVSNRIERLVVTGDLSRKQADRLHALAQGLYDRVLEKLEDSDVEACLDCKD